MLNDPGRLLAVHLVHTRLGSDWAASMVADIPMHPKPSTGLEHRQALLLTPLIQVFNPMWRQGMFVMPFMARLGVLRSR